jgi:hypothetical protein
LNLKAASRQPEAAFFFINLLSAMYLIAIRVRHCWARRNGLLDFLQGDAQRLDVVRRGVLSGSWGRLCGVSSTADNKLL